MAHWRDEFKGQSNAGLNLIHKIQSKLDSFSDYFIHSKFDVSADIIEISKIDQYDKDSAMYVHISVFGKQNSDLTVPAMGICLEVETTGAVTIVEAELREDLLDLAPIPAGQDDEVLETIGDFIWYSYPMHPVREAGTDLKALGFLPPIENRDTPPPPPGLT